MEKKNIILIIVVFVLFIFLGLLFNKSPKNNVKYNYELKDFVMKIKNDDIVLKNDIVVTNFLVNYEFLKIIQIM